MWRNLTANAAAMEGAGKESEGRGHAAAVGIDNTSTHGMHGRAKKMEYLTAR